MRPPVTSILAASLLLGTTVAAQPADTTKVSRDPLFTGTDAVIAGVFALGLVTAWPLDRSAARRLQDSSVQAISAAKDAKSFFNWIAVPGSLYIGTSMYVAGRLAGRGPAARRVADLGLHGTEAVLLGANIVGVIKGTAGRARPRVDVENPRDFKFWRGFKNKDGNYRSFPSGHSVMGFAAAASVTAETSKWWPGSTPFIAPVMYGGASMIALSRMYGNDHWASDVMLGAAIGTFSGLKVVKYHHSHPDNRIDRFMLARDSKAHARLERWVIGASVLPNPRGGVTVAWTVTPRVQ